MKKKKTEKKEEKKRRKLEKKLEKQKMKEKRKRKKLDKKVRKFEKKRMKKENKRINKIMKKHEKNEKRLDKKKAKIMKKHEKNDKNEIVIKEKHEEKKLKKKKFGKLIAFISVSVVLAGIVYTFTLDFLYATIALISFLILIGVYQLIKKVLKKAEKINKLEAVFPDFIELMASNLRAGMTIDKALLLSSRKEFAPLDKEILILGKDIVTGIDISKALSDLADRIQSKKILKTITIINSGIRSGGNLAVLLEQTAINMRTRGFTEKKAASNVLMYVIFIFFAVAIGAPTLFALSSVLVQVLTDILTNIPTIETETLNVPFTLTAVSISPAFITYFAIIFLIIINILASLLLGLVNRGEEKAGLRYTIPLIILSTTVFFIIRTVLLSYFSGIV